MLYFLNIGSSVAKLHHFYAALAKTLAPAPALLYGYQKLVKEQLLLFFQMILQVLNCYKC
jgi:hypothetical protein